MWKNSWQNSTYITNKKTPKNLGIERNVLNLTYVNENSGASIFSGEIMIHEKRNNLDFIKLKNLGYLKML